ncbi:MAG: hypothetical protein FJZ38_07335 [Candidatus Rokubacteria bacterium]|nr:hypothetical protein [Candidatus Rokubacteria bacterium]
MKRTGTSSFAALSRAGQVDRAIEVLIAREPGLSKDSGIAAVQLRFLALPCDNTDLEEVMRLALAGQREKALPGLCRALGIDEDRGRRVLEFFLRGRA